MQSTDTQQNIPSGWQTLPIGKHIKLQGGNAFSASNYVSDGIPLVRIGNVGKGVFVANDFVYISEDEHANNESVHLRENDILMGMTGELGKVARIGKKHLPAILNQRVGRVVFKDKDLDPDFTFQVFLSKDFISKLEKYFIGAAQKNISSSQVESIEILLPPIKEQQKIAEILGTVDEDIAKTQEVIEATEKLKRGLMQQLFTRGIDDGVSELELGKISKVTSSKRIMRSEYVENGIPFYRSKEIIEKAKGIKHDSVFYISQKRFDEIEKKFGSPHIGDILITAVGTIGVVYLVNEEKFYFKDGNLLWIKDIDKSLDRSYLKYFMNSEIFQKRVLGTAIGSNQKALTIEKVEKVIVPIPKLPEQQKIAEILYAVDEKISVNKKLKEKLTLLKKGLMQDLLSGKVRTI